MSKQREHPFIWATWLPRLLTGENSCAWATWFKTHFHNWTRQPSNFDLASAVGNAFNIAALWDEPA